MFDKVKSLLHDLDMGMQPISVLFPYLPTSFHRKRDACAASTPCHPYMIVRLSAQSPRV